LCPQQGSCKCCRAGVMDHCTRAGILAACALPPCGGVCEAVRVCWLMRAHARCRFVCVCGRVAALRCAVCTAAVALLARLAAMSDSGVLVEASISCCQCVHQPASMLVRPARSLHTSSASVRMHRRIPAQHRHLAGRCPGAMLCLWRRGKYCVVCCGERGRGASCWVIRSQQPCMQTSVCCITRERPKSVCSLHCCAWALARGAHMRSTRELVSERARPSGAARDAASNLLPSRAFVVALV
jgi:hypothetical protein